MRRNLTEDQKALLANELQQELSEKALQEKYVSQQRGIDGQFAPSSVTLSDDGKRDTRKEAAQAVGVSERKVRQAKKVQDANPELAEQVRAGTKSLRQAIWLHPGDAERSCGDQDSG